VCWCGLDSPDGGLFEQSNEPSGSIKFAGNMLTDWITTKV
jgi:hypothetical protein